jgi:diguanylate cyclase (GGDEF)-like protein/PAS domain S-box-containing protein
MSTSTARIKPKSSVAKRNYDAELISLLLKTSHDMLFIIDFDSPNNAGKFTEVNNVACRKLGYSRQEFHNLNPIKLIAEESLDKIPVLTADMLSERAVLEEIVLVGKDGHKLFTELNMHLIKYRGRFVSFGIVRDITDRLKLEKAWKELLQELEDKIGQRTSDIMEINRELQQEILDRIKTEQILAEKEQQLRLITDNMHDIIVQFAADGQIKYVSPSFKTILGHDPAAVVGTTIFDWIHKYDAPTIAVAVEKVMLTDEPVLAEFRMRHADNHWVWAEGIGKRLCDASGRVIGIVSSNRDITNRKRLEEQFKFQSERDPITGLYNRNYFEKQMARFIGHTTDNVGLLTCDLDGLKYVNDTLGHETGDQLLSNTAKLIQRCFAGKGVIARIGGDEFAVIFLDASDGKMEEARALLKEAVETYNCTHAKIPICLSVGTAVAGPTLSVAGLFKEADNSMYREKLHSRHSSRSSVVQALKKALEVRDFVTEGHASRLKELSVQLAKMCNLPDYKLTDLRLFAEFHDIGKVGIPDHILFKAGPLTTEEMNIMKSHCEIGHRIAVSSPDLEPIADWILKHHEWWNGKGYPMGLTEYNIPLECRILAIVDAYDAMTNDRPYRKAISVDAALAEIKKCAGKQFDPELAEKFLLILQPSLIAKRKSKPSL